MKKILFSTLLLFSIISSLCIEQINDLPQPLKVLYPFTIKVKFDKAYNLIKANLVKNENLLKLDEDNWNVTLTDSLSLSLMALRAGRIEIPAIEVITFDELGQDTLYTEPFSIDVLAVTDSNSTLTDIKAIQKSKEPISLESQYGWLYSLIKYLIIFLILALVIYLMMKIYPKVREFFYKNKLTNEFKEILPWEFALNELNNIKNRMLLVSGKEYYFSIEMSLLMRRFIEKYYSYPAAERTTSELEKDLRKTDILNKDMIINILKLLDKVKYTKGKSLGEFVSDEVFNTFSQYIKEIQRIELSKVSEEEKKK